MRFRISDCERVIVKRFQAAKYPSIYKTDQTDRILFIETVDFNVCSTLLKGKTVSFVKYNEIVGTYQHYLSQVDISEFDEDALLHYQDLVTIMEIFKMYNDFQT